MDITIHAVHSTVRISMGGIKLILNFAETKKPISEQTLQQSLTRQEAAKKLGNYWKA